MNPILTTRIVIADDHAFFRAGFKSIFQHQYPQEIEFVAEASNGQELIDCVAQYQPDIVLTDIQMPAMDGIAASRVIRQQFPGTAVIAFSMFTDTSHIMHMLQAGASGYLVKSSPHQEVMEAIRSVSRQETYYCSTVSEKIYGTVLDSFNKKTRSKPPVFSEQEKKIMLFICQQLSTKEIAQQMKLATRTVDHYREHILEKTGSRNLVGIALYAVVNEIVQLHELK